MEPQINDTMSEPVQAPRKKQPRQQLSKAMEHIRYAVTIDPIPAPKTTSTPPSESSPPEPSTATSGITSPSESDTYGVPSAIQPVRRAAHRSHSPSNNQKRTDPFAFGSRYLEEGDDIFEFNAWDHVEVDATYKEFSESQFAKQRADPVSDFDKKRFNDNPEKWWNLFYKNNRSNFFKNRKWLAQEFPVLDQVTKEGSGKAVLLEVGAGAGNSAFPILERNANEDLRIHACDFSKKAVELIRGNEKYDERFIRSDVWDVAASEESENGGLPPGIEEGSVDVVLMIFIFSALNPRQWDQAARNIWRVLKPGGQVLFRDYGRGDLAQVRFKKGRYMEENFYVRGDGTRVYFFEKEELEQIWGGIRGEESQKEKEEGLEDAMAGKLEKLTIDDDQQQPESQEPPTDAEPASKPEESPAEQQVSTRAPRPVFEIAHIGVDRRMLVNRQRRLKMYRCWMQAVFRKPGSDSAVPTSTLRQEKHTTEEQEE